MFAVVALVTVGSFAATVYVGPIDKSATFFLMPFRMFEFGCGALVLFVHGAPSRQTSRELLSVGGLLLILMSAAFLRPDTPGQEWLVLLPCIGAAVTIQAGGGTWVSRKLRQPALMGIGTISYSLYLCHWPIIFFGRFIFGESASSAVGVVTMLGLMMLVATGMYRLIERQFIVPVDPTASPWRMIAKFSAFVLPIVALTHVTFASKGFSWRMPASVLAEGRLDSPSVIKNAEEKAIGPVTVDLVGDSHAEMYVAGLVPLMNRTGNRVEYVGGAGCPILLGASLKSRRRETCIHSRDETLDHLKDRRLPLLFIERWESYGDATADYEVDGQWSNESGSFLKLEDALLPHSSLTPDDPQRATRIDQAMNINDWYLFRGVADMIIYQRVIAPRFLGATPDEAAIESAMPRAHQAFDELARLLGGQDYFAGETASLADLMLAPGIEMFTLIPEWSVLGAPHAKLVAWLSRMPARPSLQATTWERVTEQAARAA